MSLKKSTHVCEAPIGADVTLKGNSRSVLMSWEIKAHAQPTLPADIGMCVLFFIPITLFFCSWLGDISRETREVLIGGGILAVAIYSYLWILAVRQKTLFKYRIHEDGGHMAYRLYFPKYAGVFLKTFAIFTFISILSMISIDPSLIWITAGPAGITIIAAIKLLNWEDPVEHHSTDWARYDLVFIDRKRKMVVPSFQDNPLAGFEVHLEKAKIDEFVAFLKTVIPHAEFREAKWQW